MNTPIHYHSLLVLLATIYPVSLPQVAANFIPRSVAKHSNIIYLAGSVFVCALLLVVSSFLIPFDMDFTLKSTWLTAAIVAAPLLIGLEILVGAGVMKLSGVSVGGWGVNANWARVSGLGFLLTLGLAILEELIFRQLWFIILVVNLGLPVWGFILISSVAYGFNHLYYGLSTFLQKMSTGIILALLFWYSGGVIFFPAITHTLQNAIILILGRRK